MQKSREGHGENWTHLVYKLDNLFRSIRVLDENSSLTRALQCFINLFELQPIFAFSMHHSKRRHQLSTISAFICYFSCIQWFVLRTKWPGNWKALQMTSERVANWWHRFEWCIVNAKIGRSSKKFKKHWSARVTDEFSSETLILRKRLSSLYTRCVQFSPWPSLLFCTCCAGEMMIPCQVSTFSEFFL